MVEWEPRFLPSVMYWKSERKPRQKELLWGVAVWLGRSATRTVVKAWPLLGDLEGPNLPSFFPAGAAVALAAAVAPLHTSLVSAVGALVAPTHIDNENWTPAPRTHEILAVGKHLTLFQFRKIYWKFIIF